MPDDSLAALTGADLKADLSRVVVGVDFARLAPPEPIVFTQLTDLRGTIRLDHPAPEVVPLPEIFERITAPLRPVVEAFRAQFEAISAAVREVSAHLMEDPGTAAMIRGCFIRAALNGSYREPEPEGCHHLCGRGPDHECTGEADGTFTYRWVTAADFGADPTGTIDSTSAIQAALETVNASGGHPVPMCAPCRTAAAATNPEGVPRQFDGLLASLDRSVYPPPLQVQITATVDWGDPLADSDANWPDDNSNICAHVCGGDPDHACDVRAATQLTYDLPSGGTRTMPVCRPCFNSEWAAKQRYQLVSEGELVQLECKECPETLLRVASPTEVAHDAVHDACAEHDRLRHADASPAVP